MYKQIKLIVSYFFLINIFQFFYCIDSYIEIHLYLFNYV